MTPLVCLCMIVKDEADVIERCLRSALLVGIDYWVIADTGSTDDTMEIIRRVLKDIPGELHQDPWVSFAHNRTLVCERAQGTAVWLLWVDADGTLVGTTRTLPREPTSDALGIRLNIAGVGYVMIRLLRGDWRWEYEFELHEHVVIPAGTRAGFFPDLRDESFTDGARSKNPNKWLEDAQKLETMPRTSRTVFHLAQSYREANMPSEARAAYLERAAMSDGLAEERWLARFYAARMGAILKHDVWSEYISVYSERPWRLEPLVDLARHCSANGWDAFAFLLMRHAVQLVEPKQEMLMVETAMWKWGALEEYAIAAAHIGLLAESRWALEAILARTPPEEQTERVREMLQKLEEEEASRG